MVKHIGQRTVTSNAFLEDDEVDCSELPGRLKRLQQYLLDAVESDCRNFVSTISKWREAKLFEYFSPTWEDFVSDHIKQPIEWINHMIQGVQLLDPTKPILGQKAIAAAEKVDDLRRKEAIAQATNPLPKKPNNRPRRIDPAEVHRLKEEGRTSKEIAAELGCSVSRVKQIRGYNKCYHDNTYYTPPDSPDDRGTNTAYLASSIAAKSPETLIAMQQGKYPSVRAAAIDAGVVKARKTFSIGPTTDPQDFALRLKDGLSDEFLAKLTAALNELVSSNLG
jgi:hypothetical protein